VIGLLYLLDYLDYGVPVRLWETESCGCLRAAPGLR